MRAKVAAGLYFITLVLYEGCLDYQRVHVVELSELAPNFPPVIDKRFVSPAITTPLQANRLGVGCNSELRFKIPPIYDRNIQDRLHYLWFLDAKMMGPPATIEFEARATAIATLNLNKEKLTELLGADLNRNFFEQLHVVKFIVADRPYLIADSALTGKDALEDSVYWIVAFSDQAC